MNVRQKVIAALGGKCAYCPATETLEVDHIHGGGNEHRRTIKVSLERWLAKEHERLGYWPAGYQVLCKICHDKKHGRGPSMADNGTQRLNVGIPQNLLPGLTAKAGTDFGGSKSDLITEAVRLYLQSTLERSVVDDIQEHIAQVGANVLNAIQEVQVSTERMMQSVQGMLGQLKTELQHIDERLKKLESWQHQLTAGYDKLKEQIHGGNSLRWGRWKTRQ